MGEHSRLTAADGWDVDGAAGAIGHFGGRTLDFLKQHVG